MPSAEGCEHVRMLWQKLLDTYITQDSPREVNLPGDVRHRLLSSPNHFRPPSPPQLDTALEVMYELMEESVLVPFLNSVSRGSRNYTSPCTSVGEISTISAPDSPPMPPAESTQISHGSTPSSGPSRDAQTYNYEHSHQPVQPSHLALPLKPGVKFICPSRSSSGAEANNDSLTERSMSAESSSSLSELMTPLIIPPTCNSSRTQANRVPKSAE
ncbi:hypothetical protein V500_00884 [Pseudogymnoascus sp. VKM F-4518 (FW-2643)]|nr:hypothetical protein V500_00884 [Pseudogymnoascus sp. VKM F-4518 (FW-2643)]